MPLDPNTQPSRLDLKRLKWTVLFPLKICCCCQLQRVESIWCDSATDEKTSLDFAYSCLFLQWWCPSRALPPTRVGSMRGIQQSTQTRSRQSFRSHWSTYSGLELHRTSRNAPSLKERTGLKKAAGVCISARCDQLGYLPDSVERIWKCQYLLCSGVALVHWLAHGNWRSVWVPSAAKQWIWVLLASAYNCTVLLEVPHCGTETEFCCLCHFLDSEVSAETQVRSKCVRQTV